MAYENLSAGLLDYAPCQYGTSKLTFRGPKRELSRPYVAYVGGSKTYGKFVEQPFPTLAEELTGLRTVNLGCTNAGLDVFATDPVVPEICSGAELTVVQILGAQNLSNRFYTVHPRRNDRFLKASTLLQSIYGDVDFTDYNFTGHLLGSLRKRSPERFEILRRELRSIWVDRMRLFLGQIRSPILMLWVAGHSPDETNLITDGLGESPVFVDRQMIDDIRPLATEYLELVLPSDVLAEDTKGMVFSPLEAPAARGMMGVRGHAMVAEALVPVLQGLQKEKGPRKRRALRE